MHTVDVMSGNLSMHIPQSNLYIDQLFYPAGDELFCTNVQLYILYSDLADQGLSHCVHVHNVHGPHTIENTFRLLPDFT